MYDLTEVEKEFSVTLSMLRSLKMLHILREDSLCTKRQTGHEPITISIAEVLPICKCN